jgi:hypothetical protein
LIWASVPVASIDDANSTATSATRMGSGFVGEQIRFMAYLPGIDRLALSGNVRLILCQLDHIVKPQFLHGISSGTTDRRFPGMAGICRGCLTSGECRARMSPLSSLPSTHHAFHRATLLTGGTA